MQRSSAKVPGVRARNILLAIIGLVGVAAVFTFIFSARLVTALQSTAFEETDSHSASHFVVVIGSWADRAIVEQVYQGVQSSAAFLHCAVELCAPDNFAQDAPISQLLEYASFACADGVILVNSDETLNLPALTDVHGNSIPVITVGQWSETNTEISCISSNYYSMGKTAARALQNYSSESVLLLTDRAHVHQGMNSLVSSIQESYREQGAHLSVEIATIDTSTAFASDESIRETIMATEVQTVLCVSPELTSLAAQSLIDTNRTGDLKLIGLYQTERNREYLKKGMISSLITPDIELMGQYAIEEMASYLNTGYCNSYRRGNMQLLERTNVQ